MSTGAVESLVAREDMTPREKVERLFMADLAEEMKHPEFRRLLMFVIDDPTFCAVAQDAAEVSNVNQTFYELGKQRIGKLLLKRSAEAAPEMHLRMTAETMKLRAALNPPQHKP